MAVLFIVLGAGAYYLLVLTNRVRVEQPQRGEAGAQVKLREAALQSPSGASKTVTLYFPSNDETGLVQEQRQISWAADDVNRIRQILLALMEGSYQGNSRALPASTDIRAVFLTSGGTAFVDFSNSALGLFTPGIASETMAVYSIVDSLAANIPTVQRVRILVQGQEVDTLDGHVDLTEDFVPNMTPSPPAP